MDSHTDIQYIFDEHGTKTAVIIPITVWDSIKQIIGESQGDIKRKKIESLFGVLKDNPVLDEIDAYSKTLRAGTFERI